MTTNGEPPNRQVTVSQESTPTATVSGSRLVAEWNIVGRGRLSAEDRSSIERLRHVCEAFEPLDLKLEVDEADHLDRPIHFLAVAGSELVGYAGMTAGDEAEVCGMVHPEWRRAGMGAQLLLAVLVAARDLERDSILLICEDAAPVAIEWMRRAGATLESAERRMVAHLAPAANPRVGSDDSIVVRTPTEADRRAVIALLHDGSTHHQPIDADDDPLEDQAGEVRLVATQGGSVIGTLRLIDGARRSMIYGLVIDPERRGQRLGTRVLALVLAQLRAEGVTEVGLEVDPDNTPAVRLYEGFGFETVTTYRYLRMASTVA
jgi:ribosomal protein S18 acetylase RimI-like enzyme